METITDFITDALAIIAALSIFIEISPIKINPLKWLFKRIGKIINEDVDKRLDKIEADVKGLNKEITEMKDSNEQTKAENARYRILRFGDELRCGTIRPSKEHFENVLHSIDDYDRYCKDHPNFPNSQTVVTSQIIRDTYQDKLKNNSF